MPYDSICAVPSSAFRMRRVLLTCAGLALPLAGCATARQLAALRQVHFAIERASSVDLAGVRLDHIRSTRDVATLDAARVGAAVLRRQVPLVFTLHVSGENPAENAVTARLLRFSWTLLLNGRETISGAVDTVYTFEPGGPREGGIVQTTGSCTPLLRGRRPGGPAPRRRRGGARRCGRPGR